MTMMRSETADKPQNASTSPIPASGLETYVLASVSCR